MGERRGIWQVTRALAVAWLFEPILESQSRHFLEILTIGREQQGIVRDDDSGNFQIASCNSNLGRSE